MCILRKIWFHSSGCQFIFHLLSLWNLRKVASVSFLQYVPTIETKSIVILYSLFPFNERVQFSFFANLCKNNRSINMVRVKRYFRSVSSLIFLLFWGEWIIVESLHMGLIQRKYFMVLYVWKDTSSFCSHSFSIFKHAT